jgi:hypothetical protein
MRYATLAAACLLFPWAPGCQAPVKPEGPTRLTLPIVDRDAFIEATLTVLRENDFTPRRVDYREGRIEAGPTTSGQWFEFWRSDSRGGYQALESSLHTIRREVTVEIRPVAASAPAVVRRPGTRSTGAGAATPAPGVDAKAPPPTECTVDVTVEKSRYVAPSRQVTNASGALAIYSERLPTEEGLRGARSVDEQWVPLGRDGLLEKHLLSLIVLPRGT